MSRDSMAPERDAADERRPERSRSASTFRPSRFSSVSRIDVLLKSIAPERADLGYALLPQDL
jgi:hypothetical protein